jgi:hypothetical protein
MAGLAAIAGAVLGAAMLPLFSAPAHGDIEDVFQPIIDAVAQAADVTEPGLAGPLGPGFDLGSLTEPGLAATAVDNAAVPLELTDNYEAFQAYPVYISDNPDGLGTRVFDYH